MAFGSVARYQASIAWRIWSAKKPTMPPGPRGGLGAIGGVGTNVVGTDVDGGGEIVVGVGPAEAGRLPTVPLEPSVAGGGGAAMVGTLKAAAAGGAKPSTTATTATVTRTVAAIMRWRLTARHGTFHTPTICLRTATSAGARAARA